MSQPSGISCTVIVVNFNGGQFIAECLRSLAGQVAPKLQAEVVVVDNNSTDGSDEIVLRDFPAMTLIRSDRNLGFGGGVNLALAQTASQIVVLINNDAVAEPGFLTAVTAPLLDGSPHVAAVTARVILAGQFVHADGNVTGTEGKTTYVPPSGAKWTRLPDSFPEGRGTVLVNSTGNEVTASGNGRDRSWLVPEQDDSSSEVVFGFCGGGASIRRIALDEVGNFDERLFMYYEDTDLSWRLRRAGWEILYASDAVVRHRHAASSGIESRFFLTHNIRNRILVTARNGTRSMLRAALLRTVGSLVKAVGRALRPQPGPNARVQAAAGVAALTEACQLLPVYLREGRRLDATSVAKRDFILKWLVPDGS